MCSLGLPVCLAVSFAGFLWSEAHFQSIFIFFALDTFGEYSSRIFSEHPSIWVCMMLTELRLYPLETRGLLQGVLSEYNLSGAP